MDPNIIGYFKRKGPAAMRSAGLLPQPAAPPTDQPAPVVGQEDVGPPQESPTGSPISQAVRSFVLSQNGAPAGSQGHSDPLGQAMQATQRSRAFSDLAASGEKLRAALAHQQPDEQQLNRYEQEGERPMQDAMAMQKARLEGAKTGQELFKLKQEAALNDPGSQESENERQLARSNPVLQKLTEGLPLDAMSAQQLRSLYTTGFQGAKLSLEQQQMETRNALLQQAQKYRAQGLALEAQRLEQMAAGLGLRQQEFGNKIAEKATPGVTYENPLAHTIKEAEETRGYQEQLSNLDRVLGEMRSTLGRAGGQLGPTDAKQMYDALRSRAFPIIAKLEQTGNLTAGHQHVIEKQMGPGLQSWTAFINSGGLDKVLQAIQSDAHAGLATKVHSQGGTLSQQPSAEDKAALDWAKANPNDRRAARILKANGQ